jgi:uncharacterized membrane protein
VALANPATGSSFLTLIVVNGLMYYLEQTLQFVAIDRYAALTLSVIDTMRRLSIVVVSGYVLQGNPWSWVNVVGVLMVMGGGLYYNIITSTPASKKEA